MTEEFIPWREASVKHASEIHPLRRFMDDLRTFDAQQLGAHVRRLHVYCWIPLNKDDWIEFKRSWQTKRLASEFDWTNAVGAVQLKIPQGLPPFERIQLVVPIDKTSEESPFDACVLLPQEAWKEYLDGKISPSSEIYSLAASACLRLIELELDGTKFVGPIYHGDMKAMNLLDVFRKGMTTRRFIRRYAPRVRSIQLQQLSAVPATPRT